MLVDRGIERAVAVPRGQRNGVEPVLMNADEAARFLNISRATFWRYKSIGKLPNSIRLSDRIVRWRKIDLERFIDFSLESRKQE